MFAIYRAPYLTLPCLSLEGSTMYMSRSSTDARSDVAGSDLPDEKKLYAPCSHSLWFCQDMQVGKVHYAEIGNAHTRTAFASSAFRLVKGGDDDIRPGMTGKEVNLLQFPLLLSFPTTSPPLPCNPLKSKPFSFIHYVSLLFFEAPLLPCFLFFLVYFLQLQQAPL